MKYEGRVNGVDKTGCQGLDCFVEAHFESKLGFVEDRPKGDGGIIVNEVER